MNKTGWQDSFSILLRYHGVFRQGKRSKGSPARSIRVYAGGTAPGTAVDVGAMLNFSLVAVNESAPMRQSDPAGEVDARHLYSTGTHPRGIPSHPLVEPELLHPLCRPVCLARSDSGRGPSRDRPGGTPVG